MKAFATPTAPIKARRFERIRIVQTGGCAFWL
jgi:hypothetical protein